MKPTDCKTLCISILYCNGSQYKSGENSNIKSRIYLLISFALTTNIGMSKKYHCIDCGQFFSPMTKLSEVDSHQKSWHHDRRDGITLYFPSTWTYKCHTESLLWRKWTEWTVCRISEQQTGHWSSGSVPFKQVKPSTETPRKDWRQVKYGRTSSETEILGLKHKRDHSPPFGPCRGSTRLPSTFKLNGGVVLCSSFYKMNV